MHDIGAGVENINDLGAHNQLPQDGSRGLRGWLAGKYNKLHRAVLPSRVLPTAFKELEEVRKLASQPSDIDEHLELMFTEALLHRPALTVELGVRGGLSTFVFERAARLCDGWLV